LPLLFEGLGQMSYGQADASGDTVQAREKVMPEHDADGAAASRPGGRTVSFNGQRQTRILIADDHEVVRLGLRAILEAHEAWAVVAEAENGKDAITKALDCKPDLAIIDYSLPVINGIEAARQIRARLPDTEILIFTGHDSDLLVRELLEAGARAYLLKSDSNKHLITAMESLVNHKPFFMGRVSEQLLKSYFATRSPRGEGMLSPRERLVVQLIAEGHSNKEMSKILNLSVKTIETHRATAMRKLNVTSTAAIVRYAIRNKFIEP
jgi:DNA-binding NarL/FixJ family response regulator